jgi:hypothetical protein
MARFHGCLYLIGSLSQEKYNSFLKYVLGEDYDY